MASSPRCQAATWWATPVVDSRRGGGGGCHIRLHPGVVMCHRGTVPQCGSGGVGSPLRVTRATVGGEPLWENRNGGGGLRVFWNAGEIDAGGRHPIPDPPAVQSPLQTQAALQHTAAPPNPMQHPCCTLQHDAAVGMQRIVAVVIAPRALFVWWLWWIGPGMGQASVG